MSSFFSLENTIAEFAQFSIKGQKIANSVFLAALITNSLKNWIDKPKRKSLDFFNEKSYFLLLETTKIDFFLKNFQTFCKHFKIVLL